MRECLALFCPLALFASLFVFACVEAEHLLGWSGAVYQWFDAWLPVVLIVTSSVITLWLPWIIGLFSEENPKITED